MPGSHPREPAPHGRVAAWDAAVRLLHWALAALVLFDVFWDDGGWLHRVIGYVAAGVVVARLLWGAFAGGSAGLPALRPSLKATLGYLRGGTPRTPGHDPLGLWMVWLLWILVLLLGVTGWISRLDAFWGDDGIREIHSALADALLIAVAVHLAGVAIMGWRWRENLVVAMITGKKRPLNRSD
ncbi:MAG: cytochrome b/b6 domain-containing protein [Caldimonas sp.]